MEVKTQGPSVFSLFARACLLGLLATLAYYALVILWHFSHVRSLGQLTACRSNVKNLVTAMEMYGADNKGQYPEDLFALTPTYLKTIPSCASSADYRPYKLEKSPSSFTILCVGSAHKGVYVQTDRPACNSVSGLDGGDLGTSTLRKVLDMITGASPLHPNDTRKD